MILYYYAALLLGFFIRYSDAYPFAICPGTTDHLHISSVDLKPEKVQPNKPFSLKVVFKPDATYDDPITVDVSVKVYGVKVFQTKVDACSSEASQFVSCPIVGGKEQTLSVATDVPSEVPKGIEALIQISISHGSQSISCLSVKIDTESQKELEGTNENFIDYFLNTFPNEVNKDKSNGLRVESALPKEMNKHESSMRFIFQKWLDQFHETAEIDGWYPVKDDSSKESFEQRFIIFAKNFVDIAVHNRLYDAGKVSYAKKMNQFGHFNPQEFRALYLSGYRADLKKRTFLGELAKFFGKSEKPLIIPDSPSAEARVFETLEEFEKSNSAPDSVDWVAKGAVTPVKNQGSCGSCWAFSAISSLESAYFLKYGELKSFSEQELVSCETDCYGCRGGIMNSAFDWIKAHGGVCAENDYPYVSGTTGSNGFCKLSRCAPDPRSSPIGYVEVEHDEESLKRAAAQQPVSVAIEADEYAFQFYSHGVLTGECGDKDDHGVVVVGYGNLDGIDYWKVRNSWGSSWGMDGYVLIQRGKQVPNDDGECGILIDPVYPVF